VLADGGNAVDAVLAANLALGVVAPHLCGYGGDVFALVWDGDALHGYLGSGRSPQAVAPATVAAEHATMPVLGAHSITVPGAIAGWFALLDRFGTRSFGDLAHAGLTYARDGFTVSARGAELLAACTSLYADFPDILAVYGDAAEAGATLRQPALARTIETLGADGPDAYYRGPIAETIIAAVQSAGGAMTAHDLVAHAGAWTQPLRAPYRDAVIAELPPPTQGVTALEALRIVDGFALPLDGADRHHLLVEAVKQALSDRDAHVSGPEAMRLDPAELLADGWVADRRARIDPERATTPASGQPRSGGTAYLCAADADGMLVSLIQSNFLAFGSGVHVPEWGINLNNRGSSFSLEPGHVNELAPAKLPMHTLIPAMALRDGRPTLVFGTMGGDAQAQVHVQLLARIIDDASDIQDAVDAPRWAVDAATWRVAMETCFAPEIPNGLKARGHTVRTTSDLDTGMGHAHAIAVLGRDGYAVATDPRAEGAALGI